MQELKDLWMPYLGLFFIGLGLCLRYPHNWLFISSLIVLIGLGSTMLYALHKAVREQRKRNEQFRRENNIRPIRKD
jgi:hypothetical protein